MSIRQISVFVENKQGALMQITDALAKENIDLSAMSIADTQDFGILRLIAKDTDKALEVLRKESCIAALTDVVGARLRNEPGALAKVVRLLSENQVNMEYMYAFNGATPHHAYVVLRVDDNDKVEKLLQENGIKTITEEQVSEI